jgi:hypothetical protein
MNCQRFVDSVYDIARDRMLDAAVRAEALAHTRECERCAVRLEDEIAITLKLKNFAGGFQSVGASAWVETQLLKNFKAQGLNIPTSQTRYWLRYGTAAIAALLLIVFALALFRPRQTAVTSEGAKNLLAVTPATIVGSKSSPVKLPKSAQPPPSTPPKRTLIARPNRPSATSITNPSKPTSANEIATDFIPVTYGGSANLADGGRMVRVELPRSAMASFGLPFNVDRANEKVKADVLVGVDGLAHAIRFVR